MKKIASIIGTRPQFIKYTLLDKHLTGMEHICIHTGQHYDRCMSNVFFKSLNIKEPEYKLNINGTTHGKMTGKMLGEIEEILLTEKPDAVLVYGDCNTTLAGALAASKLGINVIHIESGLRSFDKSMPEEINRILVDHLSDILFCPTETAVKNLHSEGIHTGIYLTGDLMVDLLRENMHYTCNLLVNYNLHSKNYYLMTIHRQENTNRENLEIIFNSISKLDKQILFPIHPRTKNVINKNNISIPKNIQLVNPVNFLEMIYLEKNSIKIITDSGGVQKDAYELSIPCITLRNTTEWVETINNGWNILCSLDQDITRVINKFEPIKKRKNIFMDKSYELYISIINESIFV